MSPVVESSRVSQSVPGVSYKSVACGKTRGSSEGNRRSAVLRSGRKSGDKKQNEASERDDAVPDTGKGRHLVLTEEELATFRTSFCTRHHQNKCLNSDSCEKSHCLTWQRRNPYEVNYCPQLCPEIQFVKKSRKMVLYRRCTRGKSCNFAHSKEEELYHPLVYKTKQCSAYPKCSRYFCPFVHAPSELRDVSHLRHMETTNVKSSPEASPLDNGHIPTVHGENQTSNFGDLGDTLKSGLESLGALWYEPPTLSAICAYDDAALKSLYDYGTYTADDVNVGCTQWQTLSPMDHLVDTRLLEQFDPRMQGQPDAFSPIPFDEGHLVQLQYATDYADLNEHFCGLGLHDKDTQPQQHPDDYCFNDVLLKFMNEIEK
ncbi:bifunctional RING finger protein Unkempt-like/Zinc finger [Babesia duncani]|uniref:Bifunctional RING finger protein Unkempt-like/Zinc finger n=1 Tax=Babesia duncani TaxID=323732 RepID=A0AAD9PMU9_9APIC|nr:bifunctional RING finger protein Unkempt-like/Zinc finger [Babesia duncani]KAK2197746.1 bifunctional RING finger protein Unkempt-like/Zinc finger [Babesia duncani]